MALADSEAFSGFAVDDLARRPRVLWQHARLTGVRRTGQSLADAAESRGRPGGPGVPEARPHPGVLHDLELPVQDVGAEVEELTGRGVVFQHYDGMPQDADGVMRGNGPDIAWLTDPAGNILSVVAQD